MRFKKNGLRFSRVKELGMEKELAASGEKPCYICLDFPSRSCTARPEVEANGRDVMWLTGHQRGRDMTLSWAARDNMNDMNDSSQAQGFQPWSITADHDGIFKSTCQGIFTPLDLQPTGLVWIESPRR